jgi:hypothetical protein
MLSPVYTFTRLPSKLRKAKMGVGLVALGSFNKKETAAIG